MASVMSEDSDQWLSVSVALPWLPVIAQVNMKIKQVPVFHLSEQLLFLPDISSLDSWSTQCGCNEKLGNNFTLVMLFTGKNTVKRVLTQQRK